MVPSPSITSNQCSIAILPRNISSQGFSEALSECLGAIQKWYILNGDVINNECAAKVWGIPLFFISIILV
jgi:hypothetical protein